MSLLEALLASASLLASQGHIPYAQADYINKQHTAISSPQPQVKAQLEKVRFYVGVDTSYQEIPNERRALFFEYRGIVFSSIQEIARKGEHPLKFVRRVYKEQLPDKIFDRGFYHMVTELFNMINNNLLRHQDAIGPSDRINELWSRRERLPDIKMVLHQGIYEVPLPAGFSTMEEAVASTKPKK